MILEQKKGPFSKGSSFRVGGTDGRGYVHIGIQIPKSQPIAGLAHCDSIKDGHIHNPNAGNPITLIDGVVPADVSIETSEGAKEYKINAAGLLEFDANVGNSVKIIFLRDLPAECIVDIVYRPEGE